MLQPLPFSVLVKDLINYTGGHWLLGGEVQVVREWGQADISSDRPRHNPVVVLAARRSALRAAWGYQTNAEVADGSES
jgi:hypothetical protein